MKFVFLKEECNGQQMGSFFAVTGVLGIVKAKAYDSTEIVSPCFGEILGALEKFQDDTHY